MTLALEFGPRIAWSPQQRDIFAEIEHGSGHLIVQALAGCGKTTTVIEALKRLRPRTRALLCAFNKSIAEELEARAPQGVKVSTLHGLGAGTLFRHWGKAPIDNNRGRRHVEKALGQQTEGRTPRPRVERSFVSELAKVVSLCKSRLDSDPASIERAVTLAALDAPRDLSMQDLVAVVLRAMDLALEADGTVSFDDMVFVPAALELRPAPYDVVFVDETQDMSRAQLVLAQNALREGGRLVLVGDANQAIYGWRGADVGSMERMATELEATVLPLTVTRRCPQRVVALARQIVPSFEAAPDAPEGTVRVTSLPVADWSEGDLVVSRLNAPLTRCALAAIRAGKRARIQGKEFAQSFRLWAQGFGVRRAGDLVQTARGWVNAELAKLGEDDQSIAEDLLDRVDTLEALVEGCATADQVFARLDALFEDSGPGLLFSSTHRAKGMERDRVFVLAWTYKPNSGGEAANLWYVAITRAKRELVLVEHPDRCVSDALVASAIRGAR